ncbi:MAG: Rpn family recombination-promoting nuclease/putative transposase [Paludibacteraceae bacterium]|nr:Rpn family recombination-promoting nuclease/putative transposase [Paludibacteraceae bacterium]
MGKYLDPRFDLTFKNVFGRHKDLVTSFLNALIPFKEGEEIKELEYLQPEMLPDTPLRKNTIVDVRCKDRNGRQFIVEMQMYWTSEFKQRVLFNASKAYVSQATKGFDYNKLAPIYSLNLVNDNAFDGRKFYHQFQVAEKDHPDNVIEGFELIFIELTKFKPQNKSDKKMMDLWLRFLTEVNESTTDVPQEFLDSPEISKALKIVEHGAYTEEQLYAYDRFYDIIATEHTLISGTFRSGVEKGRAEGEAIGVREEKLRNAKNFKRLGIDAETISKAIGLSIEEIEKL